MLFYPLLATFGHFCFSGSVSLARVIPLFLAVAGFRAVLTFSMLLRNVWLSTPHQKNRRTCCSLARYRVTRATIDSTAEHPMVVKTGGVILQYRSLGLHWDTQIMRTYLVPLVSGVVFRVYLGHEVVDQISHQFLSNRSMGEFYHPPHEKPSKPYVHHRP